MREYHVAMARKPSVRLLPRKGALPILLDRAPVPVAIIVGFGLILLGALIVTRPLTSIVLLGIYVGCSAIVSGLAELLGRRGERAWWPRLVASVWLVSGAIILLFLERSLQLLPPAMALLLVLGGLASIGDALSPTSVSQRVLTCAWGVSQIVFGILALAWPDVTVLVVAVVFGIRTVLYGGSLAARAIRAESAQGIASSEAKTASASATTAARLDRSTFWMAAGRYALTAVLLGVCAAGWALNSWLAEGAPVADAFYDPPATVPAEHGRLIRVDDFAGQSPPDADVVRILYTTRDAFGAPAVASALVIAPSEDQAGARPVVAWNHGTTGVARGCAPSLRDASATHWAIPALNDAVARGWVVVATDYSGQGAPGVFPYLIGAGEARSSLDAVLASRELEGLALRPETVAWGHSQGGHAALWMAQLAERYAPEIDFRGTAALAPVTAPLELAQELSARDADPLLSVLVSWVLVPYADTYPEIDLRNYVAPGSRTIVREMTQRCPSEPGVIVSVLTSLGVSEDRPLYVGDLTAGPLGERLAQNAVEGPFTTPVLVAWGDADEVIPPRLQQRFVDRLCAQGDRVRWVVYGGYDHLRPLLPGSRFLPLLVNWTESQLLGGDAPTDDCARYAPASP